MTTTFKSKSVLVFTIEELEDSLKQYKKDGNYLMEVKTQEKINNLKEELARYDRETAGK